MTTSTEYKNKAISAHSLIIDSYKERILAVMDDMKCAYEFMIRDLENEIEAMKSELKSK